MRVVDLLRGGGAAGRCASRPRSRWLRGSRGGVAVKGGERQQRGAPELTGQLDLGVQQGSADPGAAGLLARPRRRPWPAGGCPTAETSSDPCPTSSPSSFLTSQRASKGLSSKPYRAWNSMLSAVGGIAFGRVGGELRPGDRGRLLGCGQVDVGRVNALDLHRASQPGRPPGYQPVIEALGGGGGAASPQAVVSSAGKWPMQRGGDRSEADASVDAGHVLGLGGAEDRGDAVVEGVAREHVRHGRREATARKAGSTPTPAISVTSPTGECEPPPTGPRSGCSTA